MKDQLVAPHARVLRVLPLWRITSGLLRDPKDNKVYLASSGKSEITFLYAMLEDGTIFRAQRGVIQFLDQKKIFEVLDPASVGFTELISSE